MKHLTLSWQRPISYRNQSIDLQSKSMGGFLYDIGLHHERVNRLNRKQLSILKIFLEHLVFYIVVYWRWFSPKCCLTNYVSRIGADKPVAYEKKLWQEDTGDCDQLVNLIFRAVWIKEFYNSTLYTHFFPSKTFFL